MLVFSFDVPEWIWLLLAVAALAALTAVLSGFVPLRRLRRNEPAEGDAPGPKVSVIALAYNGCDIEAYIEAVKAQDYHDFELIIVHEATSAANEELSERLVWQHGSGDGGGCSAVRLCFYPPGSLALSHKKLALTIGIKAATGDVIVTTSTSCRIPSPSWLSSIMRHFTAGTDIVLGFARPDFDFMPKHTRPLRRFVFVMRSAQWLGAAASGDPYRGDGLNLAYRRDLFFDAKGFGATMDLVNGEDDIFISSLADGGNTAVEFSESSVLVPEVGDELPRLFADAREHYRFTSAWLPRKPYVIAGLASVAQWVMVAAGTAASVLALPNLLLAAASAVVLLAAYFVESFMYRRAAREVGDCRGWLAAPLMLLARPVDNALFDMRNRRHRYTNYTYRRQ